MGVCRGYHAGLALELEGNVVARGITRKVADSCLVFYLNSRAAQGGGLYMPAAHTHCSDVNATAARPEENSSPPASKTRAHIVEVEDIKDWLRTYPLRNETTHFSCIMDPSAPDGGAIVWVEACEEV